ncbi:unnamed protein product [Parascedosporium putredinis]|uniref:Uncharacterized protein n=1 Tax=Parascedosporium putredinis TaxID=1442378 RepID=A0A9P1MEE6_9PEZI|nr:unnamed protein product [Parascedosporium putredinis]CAI8002485.1 unnamed protein product [Parascedosporium putredinis]
MSGRFTELRLLARERLCVPSERRRLGEPLVESAYFQVIDGVIGESAIECEASKDWTATDPESSAFCESSNPATTFKFYLGDEGYGTLNINQIWSCPSDEEGTQIIFKAYANLNVTTDPLPTSSQDPLVIEEAGPITIPFTLIAPVEITPSEEAVKFTVAELTWLWFNESRESPPIPIGAVLANITNEVTGETSSCMHTGGLDLIPPEEGGDCETSEGSGFTLCSGTVAADEYGPSYLNQVAIRFDPCSKTIQIVESWYCDADDGDDNGFKYAAFGDLTPISWDCQLLGDVESLPDASPGLPAIGTVVRNATVCNAVLSPDNNVAEGAVVVEHSLFADAFLYQAPRARGCLVDSMKPETWYWNLFPNAFLADVEPDGTVASMRSRLELGIAAPYGSPAFIALRLPILCLATAVFPIYQEGDSSPPKECSTQTRTCSPSSSLGNATIEAQTIQSSLQPRAPSQSPSLTKIPFE